MVPIKLFSRLGEDKDSLDLADGVFPFTSISSFWQKMPFKQI